MTNPFFFVLRHKQTLAVVLVVLLGNAAHAVAPKIVRTQPKHGERNVSPKVQQIVIEFDQDMATSYSWTVWGKLFPKVTGEPIWRNARTCVLPVKLELGRGYTFGINNVMSTSFKNKQGEPAAPKIVAFITGPEPQAKKVIAQYAAQNKRAFTDLKKAIDARYSYRDVRKIDWQKLFAQYETKLTTALTPDVFAFHAHGLLATVKDPHISVAVRKTRLPTMRIKYVANYSVAQLRRLVPKLKQHNRVVVTGEFADGIGYILIPTWDNRYKTLFPELTPALKRFAKSKGLIIDVRMNGGGDERLAKAFAGRFLDKAKVYAKQRYRVPNLKTFLGPFSRTLTPITKGPTYRGKVAVLMGPGNMSSAEAFLLMMRQVPNCKLIGTHSFGSSGNPQPAKLANGVTVYLPSWQAMTADGEIFEGKGIAPDIAVKTTPADFQRGDPVLTAALRWLRKADSNDKK